MYGEFTESSSFPSGRCFVFHGGQKDLLTVMTTDPQTPGLYLLNPTIYLNNSLFESPQWLFQKPSIYSH